ncbi:hypothetical protein [Oribacterium sp. WCC10]|uniref:hypothetical protein n=1 Tax=Oribacterium sp. WCC10 TaxID=1855343 RepID=UPI0008F108CD|nr:hypothetical protein [Oribacterium sp. WCC10]SFG83809.1 hypothetical protein SAMN05216356_1442 [Oribacterium sp. WCC10]
MEYYEDIARKEGIELGMSQGISEGESKKLYELVEKGIITITTGADNIGLSVDEFLNQMKLAGYKPPKQYFHRKNFRS